ncbi:hypothetical protein D9757_005814 [Collybiopsis confluens]|uniref:HCNGP-like protein n=1 Tax=Collybiopsis confluens TaxID=2823264 RepID=A0A8H5HPT3_9AGAR|nr:hypothetical protein D9757_005814 [Collybiopsis confluens]
MQNGLVAYGDDSDSGDEADSKTGTKLKAKADSTAELRIPRKPQIVIKKPKTSQRPKGHVNIEATQSGSSSTPVTSTSESSTFTPLEETLADPEPDDVQRIRTLLRPPPVPGLDDWGIPPEVPTEESVTDPALESKLKQFHELKSLPNPKHFNDTLMSNRSFRNPHLYAQLVEFVDIDERTTNFPKSVWDPDLVRYSEWDADRIGLKIVYNLFPSSHSSASGVPENTFRTTVPAIEG